MMRHAGIIVRTAAAQAQKAIAFGHVALKQLHDANEWNIFGGESQSITAGVPAGRFNDPGVAQHQKNLGKIVPGDSGLIGQLLSAHQNLGGLSRQVRQRANGVLSGD